MAKKFSERIGIDIPPTELQVDSINDELRNSLWNFFYNLYEAESQATSDNYWRKVAKYVAQHFRKTPADDLPDYSFECKDWIKDYFYSLNWFDAYNFVEFIADNHTFMTEEFYSGRKYRHRFTEDQVKETLNYFLERELSAYRFVSGILIPISDAEEVESISKTIEIADQIGLTGVHEHLKTALQLIGKKPEPDYRNSIKESISAVESVSKLIGGSGGSGISGALDEIGRLSNLHGALKSGFKSLYGFTSDSDGIRHAILDQSTVGFAEAKYMLISCSAFVNYLIQKADETGLLKAKA